MGFTGFTGSRGDLPADDGFAAGCAPPVVCLLLQDAPDVLGYGTMQTCTKCGTTKLLSEFHVRVRQGTAHHYRHCKECHRSIIRAHYSANRATYIKKAADRNVQALQKVRSYLLEYLLKHPCVDCGEKDIVVLQFDHYNGNKVTEVGTLVRRGHPLATIRAEIEKCEVVCANCHTRRTARQFGWWQLSAVSASTHRGTRTPGT